MSNYLTRIETEFSNSRARPSRLSPMDWHLAQSWFDSGIPLHIVINAMREVAEKNARNGNKKIKSLSYFTEAVEERYDLLKQNQVGKSHASVHRKIPDLDEIMKTLPDVIAEENACIVRAIADALPDCIAVEPLCSAVANLRGELLALAEETERNNLSSDDIENKLTALRVLLEPHLIVSVSDDERTQIINETRVAYGKFTLMPDAEHKVLIRKLYDEFGLPELTLFAL